MAKSKEVATTSKNEVAQQGNRNVYQQYRDEVRQTGIEGDLLRFNKLGEWIAGQEEEEIPEGTELVMGVNTFKVGWIKWEDNRPVDSRMGLLSEGFRPAAREDLGDTDEEQWETDDDDKPRDPWQRTDQVLLKDLSDGRVFTFAPSSKSGKSAIGEVAGAYGDRVQDGHEAAEMPIVRLMSSHYKHKKYGKVMVPVFELTGEWVAPSDDDAPAPKGKKAKPAKAAAKAPAKPAGKSAGGKPNGAAKGPAALPAPRKSSGGGNRARI